MSRRASRVILWFALLASPSVILADDLSERLEREFARLGSEDSAERDAAEEAIVECGRLAEAPIRVRLATENNPEVRGRLTSALHRIEIREIRSKKWAIVTANRPCRGAPLEIALSRDGRWAATAGEDGRLRVFDADNGKMLWEAEGVVTLSRFFVGFSPDGTKVCCREIPREGPPRVRVWLTGSGAERAPLIGRPLVRDLEIYRGEEGFAVIGTRTDKAVDLRDVTWVVDASGATMVEDPGDGWQAISPDGKRLAVASAFTLPFMRDRKAAVVQICSIATGVVESGPILPLPARDAVSLLRVSPDTSAAAVAFKGRIRIADLSPGAPVREIGEEVVGLAWAGSTLVSVSADGMVRWWREDRAFREVKAAESGALGLESGGGVLAVRRKDTPDPERQELASILSADSGRCLEAFEPGVELFETAAEFLLLRGKQRRLYHAGKDLADHPAFAEVMDGVLVPPICFGGSRVHVVSWDTAKSVVHSLSSDDPAVDFQSHLRDPEGVVWTEEGIVVLTGHWDAVRLDSSGAVIDRFDGDGWCFAGRHLVDLRPLGLRRGDVRGVSGDGKWVAARDRYDLVVRTVDGKGAGWRFPSTSDASGRFPSLSASFSKDGSLVAIGGVEKIEIRSTASGALAGTIDLGQEDGGTVFVAEGRRIAVRYYDAKLGGCLAVFEIDGSRVFTTPLPFHSMTPEWFVDSRYIANCYGDQFKGFELVLADVTGAAPVFERIPVPGVLRLGDPTFFPASDGQRFAVQCTDGGFFYFAIRQGLLQSLPRPGRASAHYAGILSGGGPFVVTPEGLHLYHSATGEEIRMDTELGGVSASASPDGRRIAIANGPMVTVYELR